MQEACSEKVGLRLSVFQRLQCGRNAVPQK